jgi:hypothetical protein
MGEKAIVKAVVKKKKTTFTFVHCVREVVYSMCLIRMSAKLPHRHGAGIQTRDTLQYIMEYTKLSKAFSTRLFKNSHRKHGEIVVSKVSGQLHAPADLPPGKESLLLSE